MAKVISIFLLLVCFSSAVLAQEKVYDQIGQVAFSEEFMGETEGLVLFIDQTLRSKNKRLGASMHLLAYFIFAKQLEGDYVANTIEAAKSRLKNSGLDPEGREYKTCVTALERLCKPIVFELNKIESGDADAESKLNSIVLKFYEVVKGR